MSNLDREHGVLLGVSGPTYMERAFWFREMAKIADREGCSAASNYLTTQADRAEETVKSLILEFERCAKKKR